MTGFIDQLCRRRDTGTLECELTEGRQGTLARESVVQNAPLFVAASVREISGHGPANLTLLGLATGVKREWIEEGCPEQVRSKVEHLYDRTHKRVAAVRLIRFQDLVIHHEHQADVDPEASGLCLAQAQAKGYFELPLFTHELKQFVARVNLVAAAMADLEFPPLDERAFIACLARAFRGLTLAKEAQATPLRQSLLEHLGRERAGWLDELAPVTLTWPDGRKLKLLYPPTPRGDDGAICGPEINVKLHECFPLKEHPKLCEGRVPVKLWLASPDGRRLEPTNDWVRFRAANYPKIRGALQKKFPSIPWP